MSGISTVWEDTDCCAKHYMCALDIYLMNVLSYSCGITMDLAINSPGHGKNIVYGINSTDRPYLKGKMGLIGKLGRNDTTKIGILPGSSKDTSIKFADQCLHILNDEEIFHVIKGGTKMKIIELLFKYQ